ncbi:MAG TPA: PIG-L family deacetylase [Actinomycetota bacterium]|nr:PIG-L family deacetylase [Actinomycetota bacterium]
MDVAALGTILGVWAHPDDDIYLSAGLMAVAARNGQRVVDVTATRGEGGSMDEERWPSATMGEVRTRELLLSLEILGVREHRFLEGLRDVDMQTPLDESGASQVRAIMEEVRPDTVLTFGPEGMTGHEGHKSVSRWTTAAFEACAPPGARLYHATYTRAWADRWLPRLEPFNIFLPGTPPVTPEEELAIAFELPDDVLELKHRAILAHESQVEGLAHVFGDDFKHAMALEAYRLAAERT